MKTPVWFAMPWDMVVFLSITTVGFGFSVQKLSQPKLNESFQATQAKVEEPADTSAVTMANVLDLGCVERRLGRERVASQDTAIRIKGKFCNLGRRAMRAFGGVQVRNLSNGYQGTIFFHGFEAGFVSDAVMLQSGKNLIQIEWKDARTSELRQYVAEVFQK